MAVGAVLALVGALLVAVTLLRRPPPVPPVPPGYDGPPPSLGDQGDQTRTLTVVSGLVLAVLGAVTLSAGALADGDDDGDTATGGTAPTSAQDDGTDVPEATDDPDGTDPERTDESSPPATRSELPDCFDQHLARDPVVRADHHVRLVEGVSVPITPVQATALELADGDEVLGVMRVVHEPLARFVHIYDAVDATCTPVPVDAAEVLDEVERSTRTTIPLRLGDRNYELTFDGVENGHTFDATLRHTG